MSSYHIAAIVMLTVHALRAVSVVVHSQENGAAKAGHALARATGAIAWGSSSTGSGATEGIQWA